MQESAAGSRGRPSVARSNANGAERIVQRLAAHVSPREEDAFVMPEEEGMPVQRKAYRIAHEASYFAPRYASGEFSRRLETRAGAGEPLDARLRAELAPWFAGYLDGVRIHHGQEAGELAKQISARAFTTGRDIYFAPGEYRPKTTEGRRVLAHELAHVAQQADGRAESVAQRLSAPRRVTKRNVHPWGDAISGDNYEVETDGGTPISAWTAYSPWRIEYHYWCHGHSLGTFENYGYSVYSGDPMMETVNQEWSPVASGSTRAGDIAVWVPTYEHSCRVVSPSFANSQLDPNATQVSSKNGQDPLVSTTLANIMTVYPGATPAFYRRR
ncbi:MAG: DUF4157 domain-containing protein [Methylocella sp.]